MADRLVRLKSLIRQIYGGRALKPGDPFPEAVPERTARGLIAHHFAEEDSGYETRVMTAEESALVPRVKRAYKRRDMRAKR